MPSPYFDAGWLFRRIHAWVYTGNNAICNVEKLIRTVKGDISVKTDRINDFCAVPTGPGSRFRQTKRREGGFMQSEGEAPFPKPGKSDLALGCLLTQLAKMIII